MESKFPFGSLDESFEMSSILCMAVVYLELLAEESIQSKAMAHVDGVREIIARIYAVKPWLLENKIDDARREDRDREIIRARNAINAAGPLTVRRAGWFVIFNAHTGTFLRGANYPWSWDSEPRFALQHTHEAAVLALSNPRMPRDLVIVPRDEAEQFVADWIHDKNVEAE